MMNSLSKLVSYQHKIISLRNELTLQTEICNRNDRFNGIDSSGLGDKTKVRDVLDVYNGLVELNTSLDQKLDILIQSLEDEINIAGALLEKDPEYINKFNEQSWPIGLIDPYQTANQQYLIDIQQQLTQYAMWKFPGLQLYPQSKQWTDVMLASDPVYLVACIKDTLSHIIEHYPGLYQRRLRLYSSVVSSDTIDRSLKFLPQNQIGYVVMWNTPLYLTSDLLRQYLESIYNVLRPGGVCVFNYNNCSIPASAKLAEDKLFSFSTSNIIKQMTSNIGFENVLFTDVELPDLTYTHMSWVEIRKPGTLSTIKAHQPLAEIIEN
jgi:hypothetical protein